MFQRLGLVCYQRRRRVLVAWIAVLIALVALANAAGGAFDNKFELPGSESKSAFDLLKRTGFSERAGFSGQVVFEARQGVNDPTVRTSMQRVFGDIEGAATGVHVASPYDAGGSRQISRDGRIAYGEIDFTDRPIDRYMSDAKHIKDVVKREPVGGVRVELGGDIFAAQTFNGQEGIGVLAAIIILLVAFGSVLAMGLPILTALFGLGCGIAVVELAANVIVMPNFTTQAAAMIGIGVGIDYSLFIITRFRQALHDGREPRDAVVLAMDTAGRAVLFAGITVVISLLGMLTVGLAIPRGVGIGAALAVLLVMLASLTLLPAILGFTGRNIDKFGLPHRKHAEGEVREAFWYRWSRVVQHRPWPAALAGLVVLLALALPVFSLRLGFSDAGNRPTSDTTRRAYDMLSEAFGPGFNGPLLVATATPHGASDLATLRALGSDFRQTPGVVFVTPPIPNAAQTAAIMQVFPSTSPQDEATNRLVRHLRADVVPPAVQGTGLSPKIGGITTATVDFAHFTGRRLPVFMGAVLALSFLLLLVVFRSILVPIKAVVMNLLSIGAAYGVIVAVFQWGWAHNLVGVGREGPIDAWAPMMLFAVVFGLSMDYEVFLLSRIREEYDRNGDNGLAVADGLAATARVITAAAAIMVCVFASFVLGDDRSIKLFGLGLAVAVFVDATVVRMVLVPATMELLGDRNWWLPKWLQRVVPVVHVDAELDTVDVELAALTAEQAGVTRGGGG